MGIRITELTGQDYPHQLNMLGEHIKRERKEKLEHCLDEIRGRFGYWAVARGTLLADKTLSCAGLSGCAMLPAGR